jgi:hypothetical protein
MDDFRFEQLDIWKEVIVISDILFDYNVARRSDFKCVNILHIFERRKIITIEEKQVVKSQLLLLSKKITSFRKTLI